MLNTIEEKNYSISVFVLLLAVFTSGHVILVDALAARFILQVVMIFLSLLVIVKCIKVKINSSGYVLLLLPIVLMIGEIVARQHINKLAGYTLAVVLVYIIFVSKRRYLIQLIHSLHRINIFFAVLGMIGLVLSFWYIELYKAMKVFSAYYNNKFPSGVELLRLIGHADTSISIGGVMVLRGVGHLTQASLFPAYILLPLSIVLAYSRVHPAGVFVLLLFTFLSMGGNSYVAIAFAVVLYFLHNFFSRKMLVVLPFIFLTIFLCVLALVFYDVFDPNSIKSISRNAAGSINQDDPLTNRLGSGFSRLILISFATIEYFNNFPLPSDSQVLSLTFGSNIVTNGLRAGFFGALISAIIYYKLFKTISEGLKESRTHDRMKIFGFCLMYSIVFQSMVYNDFGFSTYYGLVMFACILALSGKNKLSSHTL